MSATGAEDAHRRCRRHVLVSFIFLGNKAKTVRQIVTLGKHGPTTNITRKQYLQEGARTKPDKCPSSSYPCTPWYSVLGTGWQSRTICISIIHSHARVLSLHINKTPSSTEPDSNRSCILEIGLRYNSLLIIFISETLSHINYFKWHFLLKPPGFLIPMAPFGSSFHYPHWLCNETCACVFRSSHDRITIPLYPTWLRAGCGNKGKVKHSSGVGPLPSPPTADTASWKVIFIYLTEVHLFY